MTLPTFPVDDTALDRLEHALGTSYGSIGPDGPELVGGEYTLNRLLEFYSGYDPSKLIDEGTGPSPFGGEDVHWTFYPEPVYSDHDVIRALIEEVRRLRGS